MWQYAVCRTIAELKGYEWGINPSPTHDYFNGKSQMDFMEVDFGKNVEGITKEFHEGWLTIQHVDNVNVTVLDKRLYEIEDNTTMIGHNGAFGGIYQSEDYIIDRKNDIIEWYRIRDSYRDNYNKLLSDMGIILDDNLCVINFRGGEYNQLHNVILRREYWRDSISHMLEVNPDMKFLVVTDDINSSKAYMPFDIPTIHVDVGFDYYVVNQAKWLIISNSSFGWWAAWLNAGCNKIIAPKYWARHNVSCGYWATGDVYTRCFTYMDRDGVMSDYNKCKEEALKYYENIRLF